MTIAFPAGETGSSLFRSALVDAVAGYPEVFRGLSVPDGSKAFKRALPELIGEFEARRAAAAERVEIAGDLAAHLAQRARFGEGALDEALASGTCQAPTSSRGTAEPGWTPSVDYRGRTWRGAEIAELAQRMRAEYQLTQAAADALEWVATERLQEPLVLEGERFALLGAGAELSPARYLLEAGATVLWIDRAAPSVEPATHAGTLLHHTDAGDLLTETPAISAALASSLEEGPLHLGLYAYAPGKGRELLLTAAMNALAERCEPASIAMLVSPTTPGEVQPEDAEDRVRRRLAAPRWQRALARGRVLPEPAYHQAGEVQISRSIVALQGPTYLAAQYLMKMMAAEHWAVQRAPLRVSANVAGITATRSLEHPLFKAGFLGGPTFGIEVFTPEQTRVLSTLLMLHDVLNPDAPAAEPGLEPRQRARRVAAQSVHGGLRSLPFVLEPTIRAGAVVGLTKKPSLLVQLLKGR